MKPFKKRKIFIGQNSVFYKSCILREKLIKILLEPTICSEEVLNAAIDDSKKLLFPYDNQSTENVTELVQTLTKGISNKDGDCRLDLWKKIMLHVFYVRKSLKPEVMYHHIKSNMMTLTSYKLFSATT